MSLNYPSDKSALLQLAEVMEEIVFVRQIEPNTFDYVSSKCQQLLGCRIEELYLASPSWIATVHPEDKKGVALAWRSILVNLNLVRTYFCIDYCHEQF